MKNAFFNGKIVPFSEARLPLNDIGILRGYGVCDVARTRNRKPFLIERHLARFRQSAERFRILIPYSDQELSAAITLLIGDVQEEASIKMIATGGPSLDGTTFNPHTPTVYILVSHFTPLPDLLFTDGVKLITHQYQRPFSEVKSLNYQTMVEAQPMRDAAGAFEILYVENKLVKEAATSNIFSVKGGVISTPNSGILPGITRSIVLDLARQQYEVEERPVTINQLLDADEVFLTATNKDVLPVKQIDSRVYGVGPCTQHILKIFRTNYSEY